MISDKEIKETIERMDKGVWQDIDMMLRKHDFNMTAMLSHFVASICDVDVADIFSVNNKAYCTQARWMFWYAYRYMTRETYERIAERTAFDGHKFHTQAIVHGINSFAKLIDYDTAWAHKWHIIKHIIKIKNDAQVVQEEKTQISITVPKNVEVKIKKQ